MEKASFREILKQMLQAEEAALNLEKTSLKPATTNVESAVPLFHFEAPKANFASQKGYRATPKSAARPEPKLEVVPEVLINFADLKTEDQSDAQLLIVLGADFKNGISLNRLKKEHRRLAKRLHPDRLNQTLTATEKDLAREKFLILQAAYERLSESLNSRACGNGSASESKSQHRDAA